MPRDWLEGVRDEYDVIVVGSGLAGLTGANHLARCGYSVLLLEHHYQFGGLATWFRRKGGHIFDISLHGFPVGMIKSCRRYWTREIADAIVPLRGIRFINPQFNLWTQFDRTDFTRHLTDTFRLARRQVDSFFDRLKELTFVDDPSQTTGELFEEHFPGRPDVHRLLIEPIAFANGSRLDDPALTFGIVFANFMKKGVYTFRGGTDWLISKMVAELKNGGVDLRKNALVERFHVATQAGRRMIEGVTVNGRKIACRALLSNASLHNTILRLTGEEQIGKEFADTARQVRLNHSSSQVYFGYEPGTKLPELGDLVFTSEDDRFTSDRLLARDTGSRTFSIYYEETRPDVRKPRPSIVCSLNSQYQDWASLSEDDYQREKSRLSETAREALERFAPDAAQQISYTEAATPRTIESYTRHARGSSFGTKFEGLKVSMDLPKQVMGLFHAGSVGIIMSGWLGTINYGSLVARKIEALLEGREESAEDPEAERT